MMFPDIVVLLNMRFLNKLVLLNMRFLNKLVLLNMEHRFNSIPRKKLILRLAINEEEKGGYRKGLLKLGCEGGEAPNHYRGIPISELFTVFHGMFASTILGYWEEVLKFELEIYLVGLLPLYFGQQDSTISKWRQG
ncbi:hypothetical protein NE237_022614 [Protea cynaroides]|uniref:Uncharacterized protein n=1 Tax=Protea cynaroides TaxID=273540 RepID=A0A9Q0K5F9_9MAGN|nr:hypothetical protein NE237_022614 [Protea cynaroides]